MARPTHIAQVLTPDIADTATARAVTTLGDAVRRLQARSQPLVIPVSLVVGRNAVAHALGRPYTFAAVMPTASGATAIVVTDNPHPDRHVLIDVSGVDMPGSAVLVV